MATIYNTEYIQTVLGFHTKSYLPLVYWFIQNLTVWLLY